MIDILCKTYRLVLEPHVAEEKQLPSLTDKAAPVKDKPKMNASRECSNVSVQTEVTLDDLKQATVPKKAKVPAKDITAGLSHMLTEIKL